MKAVSSQSGIPAPYLRVSPVGDAGWRRADRAFDKLTACAKKDGAPSRLPAADAELRRNISLRLRAYQSETRRRFAGMFGPLPDAARRVDFEWGRSYSFAGIDVRHVVLTSDLGYRISALTLKRKGVRRAMPGMIWATGHYESGACHPDTLRLALMAAMSGFYVVTFDSPGQGCRREVFLEDDDPVYWSPSRQHQNLAGVVSLVNGGLERFFARDCVTVVSFISQRDEVDAARIGFGGQSGGGLQTYLAMGADPRIACAVPVQATSTRRGAFEERQFRDAEQSFFRCWKEGIDCLEMAALFAPRPLRIDCEHGYKDQLDVFHKIRPVYEALGCADRIEMVSSGCRHELSRTAREMVVQWFSRWLGPATPVCVEPEIKDFDAFSKELVCEQAMASLREHGLITYCAGESERLAGRRSGRAQVVRRIPWLRGIAGGQKSVPDKMAAHGVGSLRIGENYCVPFRLAKGQGTLCEVAVIVDADGKDSAWARGNARKASALARRVISMDVFNCGELRTNLPLRDNDYYRKNKFFFSPDVYHAFDAFMAGTCPVGLAMEEVRLVLRACGLERAPLLLAGRGWPALAALMLSAALPDVRQCRLSGLPESFETMLKSGRLLFGFEYIIPDVLRHTDIPLIIRDNRKTSYVLNDIRRFGAPMVDYTDRRAFPNVIDAQG